MKRTKDTEKLTSITLAHINDTHSYFEPTSQQLTLNINGKTLTPFVSTGGFARIATRTQQLKQDAERMNREFIFLHAGDCFQGTLYFSLFKGKANTVFTPRQASGHSLSAASALSVASSNV